MTCYELCLIHEQIDRIADDIINSPWPKVAALGTIGVGFLAIFGEPIRKWLLPPRLSAVEIKSTYQRCNQDKYRYQRLIIQNIGLSAAREVRVLMTYAKNGEPPPEDFIPIPLGWMHWRGPSRDISRSEPAYVDVLKKKEGEEKYNFCWAEGLAGSSDPLLDKYNPEHGNIRLEFFERDRKVGNVTLRYSSGTDKLEIIK